MKRKAPYTLLHHFFRLTLVVVMLFPALQGWCPQGEDCCSSAAFFERSDFETQECCCSGDAERGEGCSACSTSVSENQSTDPLSMPPKVLPELTLYRVAEFHFTPFRIVVELLTQCGAAAPVLPPELSQMGVYRC